MSPRAVDAAARAAGWLTERMSRGALKQAGQSIDRDDELRRELIAAARRAGRALDDATCAGPGLALLRAARDREEASQVRKNPIARDEAFTCASCGRAVAPHGRTARDHCPHCLCSLHVDVVPGDRAADCGGLLRPTGVELRSGAPFLLYRCDRCGAARVNRALLDGEPPDDWERVVAVSARSGA